MSAVQQRIQPTSRQTSRQTTAWAIDWPSQIKLALVLSALTVIVMIGLAGRVGEQVLVVGLITLASVLSWHRVDFRPARPAHVRVRRR